jgi:hypothetical protein
MSSEEEVEYDWKYDKKLSNMTKKDKKLKKIANDESGGQPTAFLSYQFKEDDLKFEIEVGLGSSLTIGFVTKDVYKSKNYAWECKIII